MIDINITGFDESLKRAARALTHVRGGFEKAVSLSLNRTLEGLRTDAARETKERYYLNSSEIKNSMSLKKSSPGDLNAVLKSRGKRKSLADYQLTPKAPKPGARPQLRGAVKKAGGLKSLGNAFLIRRSGKYRPYYRDNGKLHAFISPAVPQAVANDETVEKLNQSAGERFEKRINHEVLRLLGALP